MSFELLEPVAKKCILTLAAIEKGRSGAAKVYAGEYMKAGKALAAICEMFVDMDELPYSFICQDSTSAVALDFLDTYAVSCMIRDGSGIDVLVDLFAKLGVKSYK